MKNFIIDEYERILNNKDNSDSNYFYSKYSRRDELFFIFELNYYNRLEIMNLIESDFFKKLYDFQDSDKEDLYIKINSIQKEERLYYFQFDDSLKFLEYDNILNQNSINNIEENDILINSLYNENHYMIIKKLSSFSLDNQFKDNQIFKILEISDDFKEFYKNNILNDLFIISDNDYFDSFSNYFFFKIKDYKFFD